MSVLELRDVEAGYLKGVKVLQGLSLDVGEGEIVCLIGPNGAGKSTVLRTITGILRPTRGHIRFQGRDIGGMRPDQILRLGIAHVPQGHSSFPAMTVHENLLMGAYALRDRRERERRLAEVYERFPMLHERRKERAGNLSGGQQKVLEIGRALMMRPRLMLLDEPSLGLAPKVAQLAFETIRRLRDEAGISILMVEQNARSGLAISDRAYVLELGRERLEGPARDLLADPRVGRLYLGAGVGGPGDGRAVRVRP
ncbi:MAG TPA: ABC transporter ATP-binding protein [Actinomycetota bacterium]|nr:ABC transporter ATP-binding protein [Actinomycetota bacterium]